MNRSKSRHPGQSRGQPSDSRWWQWPAFVLAGLICIALVIGLRFSQRRQVEPPVETAAVPDIPGVESGSSELLSYLTNIKKAELASVRGDFPAAARFYQRALTLTESKTEAQQGLLSSLLSISTNDSPEAAMQLALEVLRENPDDPALLMTFTDASALLGNIYGPEGMEGALKRLGQVLAKEEVDPALRVYFIASGWVAAGRQDLALAEVKRGLDAESDNRSLIPVACQLAAAAQDWEACLAYAKRLEVLTPDAAEPTWYRAMALENLGRGDDAKKAYQKLAKEYPDDSLGYFGIADLLRNEQDFQGSLHWVQEWLVRSPNDAKAVRRLVRLLVLTGDTQQANELAEQHLASAGERPTHQSHDAADAQTPEPNEPTEDTLDASEEAYRFDMALAVAAAFLDAGASAAAEAWAERSLGLAEQLPPISRDVGMVQVLTVLGEVQWSHCREASEPSARRQHLSKAIAAYEAALQISPKHMLAGNNLAWILNYSGQTQRALDLIERLREGSYGGKPVTGDRLPLNFLDTMGAVYLDARQYEQALELFQHASKRYATEPQVFLYLGKSYAGLNQRVPATENLQHALRLAKQRAQLAQDQDRKRMWSAIAADAEKAMESLRGT